jgi:glycerol uptake operon antiterminator
MFGQILIPAIKSEAHLNVFLSSQYMYGILLNFTLEDIIHIIPKVHAHQKKIILHLELTKGLSNDEYGAIFAIQNLKIDGIISTKSSVIKICKKRHVIGIFRLFLKDRMALDHNISQLLTIRPSVVEVLPVMPHYIREIKSKCDSHVITGGLITEQAQIDEAIQAGASSVTVSKLALWHT